MTEDLDLSAAMLDRRRTRLRRFVAVSTAVGLVGAVLSVPTMASAQDPEPAEVVNPAPNLGGYVTETSGAPLSILIFAPVTPVPADPGKPHLQAEHAYVLTNLTTGPAGRALASSLWPGPLVGDGFNLITGAGDYPFKTDLTSPGQQKEATNEAPGGAGMRSFADGFQTRAIAQAGESPAGDQVAFGNFDGEAVSQLFEGRAVSTTVVTAQDVNLLGGVITIDSVETRITSSSDGIESTTGGRTTVSGLTIAGQGYTVDENGLTPVGGDNAAPAPGNPASQELSDNLGIEVELVEHVENLDGARGSRFAGGLNIRVDTKVLRTALDPAVEPVEGVLQEVPAVPDPVGAGEQLPDEVPVDPFASPYLTLLPAFLAAPEVHFIIGRAESETVATLPLVFDFAPLPPPPPPVTPPPPATTPPPPATTPSTTTTTTPSTVSSPVRTTTTSAPTTTAAPAAAPPPPVVAPVATQPVAFLPGIVDTTGIPALLALLGMLGAVGGSWLLRGLSAAALGMAGRCGHGRPTDLPTLERAA